MVYRQSFQLSNYLSFCNSFSGELQTGLLSKIRGGVYNLVGPSSNGRLDYLPALIKTDSIKNFNLSLAKTLPAVNKSLIIKN